VKSDPPDADVCIKGKAKSEYFSNVKSCVGTTPFEAEKVDVTGPEGDKQTVKFKDVEGDHEYFYIVVSHKGYVSQAVQVPNWEHDIVLRPEGSPAPAVTQTLLTPSEGPNAGPLHNTLRITSEPIGALVYINGVFKGNTPYTYDAPVGIVKVRLELEGFQSLERSYSIVAGPPLGVNLKLIAGAGADSVTPPIAVKSAPLAEPAVANPASTSSASGAGVNTNAASAGSASAASAASTTSSTANSAAPASAPAKVAPAAAEATHAPAAASAPGTSALPSQ
jgi:hypothetical protein